MCTSRNVSPEQELLPKGQVRGWLRSQTGFLNLCQLPSATGALAETAAVSKPWHFRAHTASVLVSPRAAALSSLPRGKNTCRRFCLSGIKKPKIGVENQNLSDPSAAPSSSSSATWHFCKVSSQYSNHINLSRLAWEEKKIWKDYLISRWFPPFQHGNTLEFLWNNHTMRIPILLVSKFLQRNVCVSLFSPFLRCGHSSHSIPLNKKSPKYREFGSCHSQR